ncbi:MAG: hypothetical protein E6J90_42105 [Deltaproteobacteria bacterium]|nr:MAG: hypothetical protein E6J90_42105 [Deltaproteobacteria bacterium]TMQ14704.1 MAG: hypothetical protein E6J91_14825 [Deltaproteobacteria bacterium]
MMRGIDAVGPRPLLYAVPSILGDRLRVAKDDLRGIEEVVNLSQHSTRVVAPLRDHLKPVFKFRADIDHWIRLLETRRTARRMLERLETIADADDMVPLGLGSMRAGFQHVRFIGVQAYLSTKWAIADRIDPLGLDGKPEVVAVERSRPLHSRDAAVGLVGADEQPLPDRSVRGLEDGLHGAVADRDGGNDRHDLRRLDAGEGLT